MFERLPSAAHTQTNVNAKNVREYERRMRWRAGLLDSCCNCYYGNTDVVAVAIATRPGLQSNYSRSYTSEQLNFISITASSSLTETYDLNETQIQSGLRAPHRNMSNNDITL